MLSITNVIYSLVDSASIKFSPVAWVCLGAKYKYMQHIKVYLSSRKTRKFPPIIRNHLMKKVVDLKLAIPLRKSW